MEQQEPAVTDFIPAVSFGDVSAVTEAPAEPDRELPIMEGDLAFEGELPTGPLTVDQVAVANAPQVPRRAKPTPDNVALVVPDFTKQKPMTETQKKAEAAVFTQATKGLINQQNKEKEAKNKKIENVDSDEKRRYDKYVQCCRYIRYFPAACPSDHVNPNAREEVYDKFITAVREEQDSKNLLENAKETAKLAVSAIEQGGTYVGLQLSGPRQGLYDAFAGSIDMFESEIAEFAIAYPFLFQRPLWIRALQKLGTMIYMVHKINSTNVDALRKEDPTKINQQRTAEPSRPVPAEIREKYKDL